ncbi:MAG: FAD-binding oxidoreductase [Myxococcaceae bacterium]
MGRSLWGWGNTESMPPLESVAKRAAMLGELERVAPKPFEPASLPKPRVDVPAALSTFASTDQTARAAHAHGKAYPDRFRGFRGDFAAAPDLVITPRDANEVAIAIEVCETAAIALTPFGGGSSVVGGVEPRLGPKHRGTASLDLAALGKVLEVDDVSRLARIEAGAYGPALEAQLATKGFTLRCFPQSFEFSTLGGWIATRAGGHFATLHTRIDDLTHSVTMITPRGTIATPRFPSSGAGPDPKRLVLGSEGTLGVITEAWMRIRPRPTHRAQASFNFEHFHDAVDAARELSQSGLYPSNCRLLDPVEALVHGVAFDGSSVLIVAFESDDHALQAWMDRALEIARAHHGKSERGAQSDRSGDAQSEDWRKAFLEGPYLQDALICLGVIADTFETACTWTVFPELYGQVNAAMSAALEKVCGGGAVSCRFTHVYPDGPAPYFTFIGKARPGAELEQWAELKQCASDALQKAGGTITHHHAVGRTHRDGYLRETPKPFVDALRAAKAQLDPAGMLNPGVLFES